MRKHLYTAVAIVFLSTLVGFLLVTAVDGVASGKTRCPRQRLSLGQAMRRLPEASRKGVGAVTRLYRQVDCGRRRARAADTVPAIEVFAEYAQQHQDGTVSTAVMNQFVADDGYATIGPTTGSTDAYTTAIAYALSGIEPDDSQFVAQDWGWNVPHTAVPRIQPIGLSRAADSGGPKAHVANGAIYCYSGLREDAQVWTQNHDTHVSSLTKSIGQYCADNYTVLTVKNWGHGHWVNSQTPSFCWADVRYGHGGESAWKYDDGQYHSTWIHGYSAGILGIPASGDHCLGFLPGAKTVCAFLRTDAQANPPYHDGYNDWGIHCDISTR